MLIGSTLLVTALVTPLSSSTATVPTGHAVAPAPVHCQVPCGIYGDHLRVELLKEHAATIEKAMIQIEELGKADKPNWNQLVRWISTKEEHAQKVQDQLSQYWLAQRIKAPKDGMNEKAGGRYMAQLMGNHAMTTAAMKCKQTTDVANVAAFRRALDMFQKAYFTAEDLEHLNGHKEGAGHDSDKGHADGHDGKEGASHDKDHEHKDGDHDH